MVGSERYFLSLLNSCIPTKSAVPGLKVRRLHMKNGLPKDSFVIESMRNMLWRVAFKGSKNDINMIMTCCYANLTSHRTLGQDMTG